MIKLKKKKSALSFFLPSCGFSMDIASHRNTMQANKKQQHVRGRTEEKKEGDSF